MFYQFIQTQTIPASLDLVWDFISSPDNLIEITPGYLDFKVISNGGSDKMYPGMIITYIIKPILGIPTRWMTEITHVRSKEYFVDEQRLGPYKLWHHQHKLEVVDGEVLMTDIVTYIPPLGFVGALANRFFIQQQLKNIFEYRRKAIERRFGKSSISSFATPN